MVTPSIFLFSVRVRAALMRLYVMQAEEAALDACLREPGDAQVDEKKIRDSKEELERERQGLLVEISHSLAEERRELSEKVVEVVRRDEQRKGRGRNVELALEVKGLVRLRKFAWLRSGQRALEDYLLGTLRAERIGPFRFRVVVRAMSGEDLEEEVQALLRRGNDRCVHEGFRLVAEVSDRTGRQWGRARAWDEPEGGGNLGKAWEVACSAESESAVSSAAV